LVLTAQAFFLSESGRTDTHKDTCGLVDGTSMNEECAAVDAVGAEAPTAG